MDNFEILIATDDILGNYCKLMKIILKDFCGLE